MNIHSLQFLLQMSNQNNKKNYFKWQRKKVWRRCQKSSEFKNWMYRQIYNRTSFMRLDRFVWQKRRNVLLLIIAFQYKIKLYQIAAQHTHARYRLPKSYRDYAAFGCISSLTTQCLSMLNTFLAVRLPIFVFRDTFFSPFFYEDDFLLVVFSVYS